MASVCSSQVIVASVSSHKSLRLPTTQSDEAIVASREKSSAGTASDVPQQDELAGQPTMTDREYHYCIMVFLLLGTSALYYWNSVLNTMYSVVAVKYPEYPRLADTVTSSYSSVAFVTAVTLSIVGPLDKRINVVGGVILAIMAILFPVATLQMEGRSGSAVLHVTAIIAGVAEACFQVSGYAYSVILPRPCGTWVSFGYGICGVVTFCLWMLFSQGIFDINSGEQKQITGAVWCHMAVATVITAVSVAVFYRFTHSEVAMASVARAREQRQKALEDAEKAYDMLEEEDTQGKRRSLRVHAKQYWGVFSKTWLMQVGMGLSMGMSMMAYPLIGPYRWGRSFKENDVLTGIFQICDFTGRYIPNMAWLLPCLMIPAWLVVPLTLVRGVLLGIFIWIAKSTESGDTGLLQEYSVQVVLMIAMALTHGWYASVYMARIPEGVTHPKDKARASAMGVSLLIFMIAAGLWLAKAV
eukprot:Gregarina_sp_Pseudo_9__943@NODE_1601_length_1464_cov_14_133333_g1485_i0_p1_GENE_NODE_1601_length_1464_cov_14_133333_g1485_i0NODE_1601_length_1464_cov_14_133333_g1485_i0_p1_ORF_typecomplete_len470_score100_94Nucleoside_tran/PF01733_18/4e02Nucleoside_tran/PF01733_18/2_3e28DUF4199/PF13858_6/1_8e04DUF4199/PF13858_6/2_1e03DUF4199/PF13858_6/0_0046DUF4199/PF13858_6/8_8e02EMC3_TMCO1/PF01956_16/0_75Gemini_mov/PF01708_16/2_6e02Gemini_mov/PF01708_16/9_9e03Gemini_mov/PF01708_16/3_1_NODE_1601_length_1464_cov